MATTLPRPLVEEKMRPKEKVKLSEWRSVNQVRGDAGA